MTPTLVPRLDILPPPQRLLWAELGATPSDFILYGGTAIALQLGHRQSVDFDFFGDRSAGVDDLVRTVPYLAGSEIFQRSATALTARIDRSGTVLVSFFATPDGRIEPPLRADNGICIASLLDLAGMKADVVQKRAEAKDYLDLDALIASGVSLSHTLAAARAIQGPAFNPLITLKALSYFSDGNLDGLPIDLKARLREAVRAVQLERLPDMGRLDRPFGGAPE